MNNKTLLLILLALAGIYALSRVFSGQREGTFKTELIQVDTNAVASIAINPPGEERPAFTLKKEEGQWLVTQHELTVKADQRAVQELLAALALIKTQYIAAKGQSEWAAYEVSEELGHRIQVYNKSGKVLEDFILGKLDMNPQQQSITTFIRLKGQNEIYAVDGMLSMSLGRGFEEYRTRELIKMKREMEITAFEYLLPDSSLAFQKTPTGWYFGELLLDSMKVEDYLNFLRNVPGENFADDFDELQASRLPQQQLVLKGNNMPAPFEVTVYLDTTRTLPYVLRSNYNPHTFFAQDSAWVARRLFAPVEFFLE
jgi:hypothetical protein